MAADNVNGGHFDTKRILNIQDGALSCAPHSQDERWEKPRDK